MNIQERRSKLDKRTKKITIDEFYSIEESKGDDFHDYFQNKLLPFIGLTVTSTNSLESALDFILSDVLGKTDDEGWLIIKSMGYQQKANLLVDLMKTDRETFKDFSNDEIKKIRDSLNFAGDLRNRIVHGEWESMTVDHLVKSKMKMGDQGVLFVMTEFKLVDLENDVEFIDDLANEMWSSEKFEFKR